jgi:transposase
MASIVAKSKGNKKYYYVVESQRVNGKPRIVSQVYLGAADKVAALVKEASAPVPLSATCKDFGLPGALWQAARHSGIFAALQTLWPQPRSGPSVAHYLLLAAIHRICDPGPKTEVAEWYSRTVLHHLWAFPSERFTSQAFWDCFDSINISQWDQHSDPADELNRAQSLLLGLWKHREGFGQRFLAYDTTNFHTFIASTNTRNHLAQRGHNKQGRHNLRQVGLSYIMDGETGLSVCHHVYPGNVADTVELGSAIERIVQLLDSNHIARESVTIVFDKGTAALTNTALLEEAGLGWISALPWNQAPAQLRERPIDEIPKCPGHPGVRAVAERHLVHGKEYLCVLKHSDSFAAEQMHSLTASLGKAMQSMSMLSRQLAKPGCKIKEASVRRKIAHWLSPQFMAELIKYEVRQEEERLVLEFEMNPAAFQELVVHRLGRTTLLTNRLDWTAEQVVDGYTGQQQVERVFRGLKGGDWCPWGPMFHWTDHNIQVHAFYCMLAVSLLQYVHHQSQAGWPGISIEELINQLDQIKQFVLLYPSLGDKGPERVSTVLSKQTLVQEALSKSLGIDQLTRRRG